MTIFICPSLDGLPTDKACIFRVAYGSITVKITETLGGGVHHQIDLVGMVVLAVVVLCILYFPRIIEHITIYAAVAVIEVVIMVKNAFFRINGCQMIHVVRANDRSRAICRDILLRRVSANLSFCMPLIDLLHEIVTPMRILVCGLIDILEIDAHNSHLIISQWGWNCPSLPIRCSPLITVSIYSTGTGFLLGSCTSLTAGITESPVMVGIESEFLLEHLFIGQNFLLYDRPGEFIIAMTTGEGCAGDESQCSCYQILFHLHKILIECYVTKYQLMAQN